MSLRPSPRLDGLEPCPHGGLDEDEARRLGLDPAAILDFSASVNPFGASPLAREALSTLDLARYPDGQATRLRAELARRLGVDEKYLLVGNGSAELIWLLALAYLDPGHAVLVVGPTFGEYARAAKLAGAEVHVWLTRPPCFRPDPAVIAQLVEEISPRLVFLCNPNNPTGTIISTPEIELIAAACGSALLVLDQAYAGFTPGFDDLSLVDSGRVVQMRSMTKDYGLAGLRLGYAVGPPSVLEHLRLVRPPWSVNAAAQAAGLAALADEEHLERARGEVERARAYLVSELRALGLAVVPSAANFVLVDVGDGADFRARLLQQGCCVRDCASFGLPSYVRIGIRTRPECERLVAAVRVLRPAQHARVEQAMSGSGQPDD